MPSDVPDSITGLLLKWSGGDPAALEKLMPLVYNELRRLAARYLKYSDSTTLVVAPLDHHGSMRNRSDTAYRSVVLSATTTSCVGGGY